MSGTTTTEDMTDNFTAAFDRLAELGDNPVTLEALAGVEPEAKTDPEVKVDPEPAAAAEPEIKVDPEPEAKIEPEVKTEPETKTEPAAAEPTKPEPSLKDVVERLDAMKPVAPAATEPAAIEPELYTAEEKQLIAKYHEDWPDVAKAAALERKQEYRDIMQFIFAEVAKGVGPTLQIVQTLAQRTHYDDIRAAVPDYDLDRDKVVDWVEKQPAYLRTAYQHVVSQGTPEEVSDLIARYRADTGQVGGTKPAATPVAKKVDAELPPATKQAVAALAPVSTKRSAMPQTIDPGNFEAAFEEFAKV